MKQFKAIWAWAFVLATITTTINSAPAQSGNSPATRGTITPTNNVAPPPGSRVAVAQLAAPLPTSSLAPTIGRQPSVTNALFSQPSRTAAPADTDQRIKPAYGGAKWSFGLAKTAFLANLSAPAPVTITTPDQRELRCRPSFLVYYDTASGRCVLLGTAQPRVGAIVGKDKVIYADAFKGIKADIRYTCHRRSLEQDVILRQRPADPATLGLNPQTTELQVWTEWLDSTPVATQARPLADGTVDEAVDFGTMKLVAGSAYASTNAADGTPVGKSWQSADGREFLVEAVPVKRLAKFFNALPLTALFRPARPAFSSGTEMAKAALPSTAGSSTDKMELALAAPATDGVVLDFVIVASVPVPPGAISWWPAGGNAQDALPAANHGSWAGTTAYGAGEVGQGFTFNGSSDVTVPDAASLDPTDGLTVEAWVNENGYHYDHRDLVSKDGEGWDRQFILTISRDYGTFRAAVGTASGLHYIDGQTVVQPGTWYHVAMTYDAANSNLLLYVNGQLDASGLVPDGALITTTQPVRIGGGSPAGTQPYYFTGNIDEPTIYGRALGASEIQAIYEAGGAGKDNPECVAPPTGIVGWWPGDQNALDYAGTNNGTLNNSPGYAPAVAAQGFTFNGNNNVSIPDAPELNPTNGLTVEAWINENGAHYDHRDLVSKDGEGYDREFILTISRDYGTFRAHVSTASGPYNIDGQTVVQPGTWYHVAMTYDTASSNLLLYVNGQLEASGLVPGGAMITTTQPVRIGGGAPAGYLQYYFTGSIDEPAIYNRALSAAEIASLYAAGCAGKCKTDLDADGLPDVWELHWFGNYTHTGDELDANNNTLLSDYQNGVDPNIIAFTIEVANNYVNNSSPELHLNITAGDPHYYTVLEDNTNFSTANWTAYTSADITANLGSLEGWHDLWVGLKGPAPEATVTWAWKRLKLDFTPPTLAITNPISGVVTQPMIELQGYSPEELESISFDLTNAAGLFTNQQVFVLDRRYDTNTWEFTTNTFQGFDIQLTNGVNTFTLHATDLAGNTTNVTLNYTLDYSGKTNPPVVQLHWPLDGGQICGSSFTWRGHVDDFTAQLTAQIVDAAGNTNIAPTLVERDGDFWAENLPLNSGTSILTLTATDAVGHTSVTNITVVQSALTLSMDDVSDDQLWNSTVTVYGTISAPTDYTVWVNGVKATLYGSSWQADNVPSTPGGTAVFQARAIPNSDNGGNGTDGSGGAAASYGNPGNPNSAQAQDADSQADKPPRLYVESYKYSEHGELHPSGEGYSSDGAQTYSFQDNSVGTWTMDWNDGKPSTGTYSGNGGQNTTGTLGNTSGSWTETDKYQWPASDWQPSIDGTELYDYTFTDNNGVTTPTLWSDEAWPPSIDSSGYGGGWLDIGFEHCVVQGSASGSGTFSGGYKQAKDNVAYSRTADTVMKLLTGGKAGSKSNNLFMFSATAQRSLGFSLKPNLLTDWNDQEWDFPPAWGGWINIDPTQITIMGKALDSYGYLWLVLPDNNFPPIDVTPKVKGVDHYTFIEPTPIKYKSHLEVFVRQPYPNWPNDGYDNDPNSPTYNPEPFGYPFYNLGDFDAGHAWWRLSSDASTETIRLFTAPQCARWLNEAVGYGPDDTAHMISYVPPIKEGPGHVYGGDGSQTAYRIYAVGFEGPGLIEGLKQTENLFENPGTWNSSTHNCVHEVIKTGEAAGLTLPTGDYYPEFFGKDIPPSDP